MGVPVYNCVHLIQDLGVSVDSCTQCGAGKYCETVGMTENGKDCSPGYWCLSGVDVPEPDG